MGTGKGTPINYPPNISVAAISMAAIVRQIYSLRWGYLEAWGKKLGITFDVGRIVSSLHFC